MNVDHSASFSGTRNGCNRIPKSRFSDTRIVRPRMLLNGKRGSGLMAHFVPALINEMEVTTYNIDAETLAGPFSGERELKAIISAAENTLPAVIHIPDIVRLFESITTSVKNSLQNSLSQIPSQMPIIVIASCECDVEKIPSSVNKIFHPVLNERFTLQMPGNPQRTDLLTVVLSLIYRSPKLVGLRRKVKKLEASKKRIAAAAAAAAAAIRNKTSSPQLSEEELATFHKELCQTILEYLKDVMDKSSNGDFLYPVDIKEVLDYSTYIKKPMDLTQIKRKAEAGKYQDLDSFKGDIHLIADNALEYNPDISSSDKEIRANATQLKEEVDKDLKCSPLSSYANLARWATEKKNRLSCTNYEADGNNPNKKEQTAMTPAKRGRGRPKKNERKVKKMNLTDDVYGVDETVSGHSVSSSRSHGSLKHDDFSMDQNSPHPPSTAASTPSVLGEHLSQEDYHQQSSGFNPNSKSTPPCSPINGSGGSFQGEDGNALATDLLDDNAQDGTCGNTSHLSLVLSDMKTQSTPHCPSSSSAHHQARNFVDTSANTSNDSEKYPRPLRTNVIEVDQQFDELVKLFVESTDNMTTEELELLASSLSREIESHKNDGDRTKQFQKLTEYAHKLRGVLVPTEDAPYMFTPSTPPNL